MPIKINKIDITDKVKNLQSDSKDLLQKFANLTSNNFIQVILD